MLANAMLSHYSGFRQGPANHAAKRIEKQPDATGRALWRNVEALLRSPNPIPNYRAHFDAIPNPRAVHYERVQCFASGGAVLDHDGGDDDDPVARLLAVRVRDAERRLL